MKYNILFIIVFGLLAISLTAQEKELYLSYKFNKKYNGLLRSESSSKRGNNIKVYSYGNKIVSRKFNMILNPRLDAEQKKIISGDTTYYYIVMDYAENKLILSGDLPSFKGMPKSYLLKEPLNLFEWKPSMNTKTILGYTCHKATCSFRGRDYVAWFTRDIPFKAAPWKFHGLPGVILEAYSTDGYCSWIAEQLEIRPFKKEIELPFYGWDVVDLDKHLEILKVKKRSRVEFHKRARRSEEESLRRLETIEIFDLE